MASSHESGLMKRLNDPDHATNCAVHVRGIQKTTVAQEVTELFAPYGKVVSANCYPSANNSYAIVVMETHEQAKTAILRLDDFTFKSQRLIASWAVHRGEGEKKAPPTASLPPLQEVKKREGEEAIPDVATLVDDPKEVNNCGVYVSGISDKLHKEQIEALGKSCGTVVEVYLRAVPRKQGLQSAIFVMKTHEQAARVMRTFHNKTHAGAVTIAKWAHAKKGVFAAPLTEPTPPSKPEQPATPTLAQVQAAAHEQKEKRSKPPSSPRPRKTSKTATTSATEEAAEKKKEQPMTPPPVLVPTNGNGHHSTPTLVLAEQPAPVTAAPLAVSTGDTRPPPGFGKASSDAILPPPPMMGFEPQRDIVLYVPIDVASLARANRIAIVLVKQTPGGAFY